MLVLASEGGSINRLQEHFQPMSSTTLRITLLASEWNSSKGGLSTMNRELAIQLAKHPNVSVTFFVPKCSEDDKKEASSQNITIVEARERHGYDEPIDWLSFPPRDLEIDIIIGHGVKLGKQAQVIIDYHHCKWMQVVHTVPEKLAMFKDYSGAISKGDEKQWTEVKLCKIADLVVAVGPKLCEVYSRYLRRSGKCVFNLTPGIFTELSNLKLSTDESKEFWVLVFGRGDSEDFKLKGFDIAAKAVAELNDRSYHLIFVGARGNETQLAEKLLEQGLRRSQLTVKGYLENRDDLATLLSTANLAIIPSRTEGFGLTALEALSAGLPFLVSQNSGFGEALHEIPSSSSWIVDSEDPEQWAKAIKAVREKGRETALKECQELRTHYAEKYSWEKQCNALVEMMLDLVRDLAILGCNVSNDSMQAARKVLQDIAPKLNLSENPEVENLPPEEAKRYLMRNKLKFCVLVVDAGMFKDAYENLSKRTVEYEELLGTAADKVDKKVIILVCDTCSLPPKDEAIVNDTIERIVNQRQKGFTAWLKHGRLTVDPDVLVQFLISTSPAPQPNPRTILSRDLQESTHVAPVSSADSQGSHTRNPSISERSRGFENAQNMQQLELQSAMTIPPPGITAITGESVMLKEKYSSSKPETACHQHLKAKAENTLSLGEKNAILCRDQSDITIIEELFGDELLNVPVNIFSGPPEAGSGDFLFSTQSMRSCFIVVEAKTMKEELQHRSPYENLLITARKAVDKKVVVIICNDKGNVLNNEEDAITDRIKQLLGDKGVILWWKGNKHSLHQTRQNPQQFRRSQSLSDYEGATKSIELDTQSINPEGTILLKIYRENKTGNDRVVVRPVKGDSKIKTMISEGFKYLKDTWNNVKSEALSVLGETWSDPYDALPPD